MWLQERTCSESKPFPVSTRCDPGHLLEQRGKVAGGRKPGRHGDFGRIHVPQKFLCTFDPAMHHVLMNRYTKRELERAAQLSCTQADFGGQFRDAQVLRKIGVDELPHATYRQRLNLRDLVVLVRSAP